MCLVLYIREQGFILRGAKYDGAWSMALGKRSLAFKNAIQVQSYRSPVYKNAPITINIIDSYFQDYGQPGQYRVARQTPIARTHPSRT